MSGICLRKTRAIVRSPPRRSSLELGWAPLLERSNTLEMVAGRKTKRIHLVLIAQAGLERGRERHADRRLDRLYGDRTITRNLPAKSKSRGVDFHIVDEDFNQSEPIGL